MTSKTSYLLATIVAVLAVGIASANTAYANGPQDVENLTQRGEIVIDELKELEKIAQPDDNTVQKITKLKEELKAILLVINEYGIYTHEQYEKIKSAPEELPQSDASCPNKCPPVLFFRSGFDWQMNTYFKGSTTADNWQVLGIPMTKKLSIAAQSPYWGTDWSKGFLHAFVDHGTTANITVDMNVLNGIAMVKDYPKYSTNVSAGTLVSFDKFPETTKWMPGKAKDHLVAEVGLNSIS